MPALRSKPTSGVLLWDIDGTLIRTKRPNSSSPHKNVLRRRGFMFDETKVGLSGFTDYEVFLELVNNRDELSETQLRSIFHELDEEARNLDDGSTFDLYPGVQAILESLASIGWAHGITEEFLFNCNYGESRKDITRNARETMNYKNYLKVFILGDTPKDISAARLSNFPIISIATGSFSVSDLSSCNPDLVIHNLADDAEILLEFLKIFP